MIPQVEVPLLDRMENLQKENDELKKKVEEVRREEMTRPKRKCVKEIKEKYKNYVTPMIIEKFINDHMLPPFNGNETVTEVDAPNQGPTSDCGIYICKFMELLSLNNNIPNKFHEGFCRKEEGGICSEDSYYSKL
ncbi:hypothetical protein FRX31_010043 [Thalictrum thalictroides]|uniref:Ubiquitin-like protease family profile domain-containing protein n=1 Tax=Thalictrum thalictroides TaxID=46969 RepID=A0A7J6WUS4_THATH|nr:hypothetical protein FRX31_010043 [Thalictrum thalictroides]